jgi:hypothetical protein
MFVGLEVEVDEVFTSACGCCRANCRDSCIGLGKTGYYMHVVFHSPHLDIIHKSSGIYYSLGTIRDLSVDLVCRDETYIGHVVRALGAQTSAPKAPLHSTPACTTPHLSSSILQFYITGQ